MPYTLVHLSAPDREVNVAGLPLTGMKYVIWLRFRRATGWTTREAARYLSMGRRALLDLAEAGRIAYEDRGGSVGYVFNRVDLDALADELTSTPT